MEDIGEREPVAGVSEPPLGTSGRAFGQGVMGRSLHEAESFSALGREKQVVYLPPSLHSKILLFFADIVSFFA